MIARCVFAGAAIFAAAGLIGCGAESGQGETGAIGSTSEALSVATKAAFSSAFQSDGTTDLNPDPVNRIFAASCALKDASNNEYMLVAGGFNLSGTALSDAYLYDKTNNKWIQQGALTAARGALEGIQLDDTHCLIVGGLSARTGGNTSTVVEKFTLGTHSFAARASLPAGRTRFAIDKCGSSKVVVVGGTSVAAGVETIAKTLYVYDDTGASSWTTVTADLKTARSNLALANFNPGTNTKLVAYGGWTGSTQSNLGNVINVANNCATPSTDVTVSNSIAITDGAVPTPNPLPLTGAKGFLFSTANNQVLIAGGFDGSSAPTSTLKLTVTWTVGSEALAYAAGPSLDTTGLAYPKLVKLGSDYYLVGGTDGLGKQNEVGIVNAMSNYETTPTTKNVQKFSGGTFTGTTLSIDRVGHVAEPLATTGKVYLSTGMQAASGTETGTAVTEEITP